MLAEITRATGIEATPIHPLPADLGAALEQVRGWKGREGVVGRFVDAAGAPRLIKIKAADYLRLHAYRSILGGAGALKIAWLLDIHEPSRIVPALARHGLDRGWPRRWKPARGGRSPDGGAAAHALSRHGRADGEPGDGRYGHGARAAAAPGGAGRRSARAAHDGRGRAAADTNAARGDEDPGEARSAALIALTA